MRRHLSAAAATTLGVAALASPALAADQFTIDSNATQSGAVAVDSAGNAYVAWNSTNGQAEFCKIPVGATKCPHVVVLPALTSAPLSNYAQGMVGPVSGIHAVVQPFPIVGPNGTVWIVGERYIQGDTITWTSTNGGESFTTGEVPYDSTDPPGFDDSSDPYPDTDGVTDLVALNENGNQDGYEQGSSAGVNTASGYPSVLYAESGCCNSLGFNFGEINLGLAGPPGISEFSFDNATSPGEDPGNPTLGESTYSASPGAAGDLVYVYQQSFASPTDQLAFYDFRSGHPFSPQSNWSGPASLGDGDLPREAGGSDGLFLLSEDGAKLDLVQVRKWNETSHSFGTAKTLGTYTNEGIGGGIGESDTDGEIAAVWPKVGTTSVQLEAYLSFDGGSTYSSAIPIASGIGDYGSGSGFDQARVAVANNGVGWVTFRDSKGLQIANLYDDSLPISTGKLKPLPHGLEGLTVPVTCSSNGTCKIKLSFSHGKTALGSQSFKVGSGTHKVTLKLSTKASKLFEHRVLKGKLTIGTTPPEGPAYKVSGTVTLRK